MEKGFESVSEEQILSEWKEQAKNSLYGYAHFECGDKFYRVDATLRVEKEIDNGKWVEVPDFDLAGVDPIVEESLWDETLIEDYLWLT